MSKILRIGLAQCLQTADLARNTNTIFRFLEQAAAAGVQILCFPETQTVVYHAEKHQPQRFPEHASEYLFGATARNCQIFQPLDFLAELTQHIPNQGEHLEHARRVAIDEHDQPELPWDD